MKRRKVFPKSRSELEMMPTRQLLGRLKQLHQCEQSLALSDRETSDASGHIEFKQSTEWTRAYEDVKDVLSRRPHVPKA